MADAQGAGFKVATPQSVPVPLKRKSTRPADVLSQMRPIYSPVLVGEKFTVKVHDRPHTAECALRQQADLGYGTVAIDEPVAV